MSDIAAISSHCLSGVIMLQITVNCFNTPYCLWQIQKNFDFWDWKNSIDIIKGGC